MHSVCVCADLSAAPHIAWWLPLSATCGPANCTLPARAMPNMQNRVAVSSVTACPRSRCSPPHQTRCSEAGSKNKEPQPAADITFAADEVLEKCDRYQLHDLRSYARLAVPAECLHTTICAGVCCRNMTKSLEYLTNELAGGVGLPTAAWMLLLGGWCFCSLLLLCCQALW
jgi:hypothetical protein